MLSSLVLCLEGIADTPLGFGTKDLGRFETLLTPKLYREADLYLQRLQPVYLKFVHADTCHKPSTAPNEPVFELVKNTRIRARKTANYISTCPQYCGAGLNTAEYCHYVQARFDEAKRLDLWLLRVQAIEQLYSAAISNGHDPAHELRDFSRLIVDDALLVLAQALSGSPKENLLADWRQSLHQLGSLSGLLHGLSNLGQLEPQSQRFIEDFDTILTKGLVEAMVLSDLGTVKSQTALMFIAARLVWVRNTLAQAKLEAGERVKESKPSAVCLKRWLSDVASATKTIRWELQLLEGCRSSETCPSVSTGRIFSASVTDLKAVTNSLNLSFQTQFSLVSSMCR